MIEIRMWTSSGTKTVDYNIPNLYIAERLLNVRREDGNVYSIFVRSRRGGKA